MPRSRPPAPRTVALAHNTVLENILPPPSQWEGQTRFARRQDDTDGETGPEHTLLLALAPDGDWWVKVGPAALRFRCCFGGGASPRVHAALQVLAEAIRRDTLERPQRPE